MYLLPYIHLQAHPRDVETVTIKYTIYLLNYGRHNSSIVYKIYIVNYRYILLLSCYNLEYTLFLRIKKFIHRIK